MKVTVSYNLPEEQQLFDAHMKGSESEAIIETALFRIRNLVKHTDLTENEMKLLDEIRAILIGE